MRDINIIHNRDCLSGLKNLPNNCIDCCVTSPPYFGLRDYGTAAQIGLEETPDLFVQKMVEVFAEVKRVLKPTGTLWLNLGDSYNGAKKGNTETKKTQMLLVIHLKKNFGKEQRQKTLLAFRGWWPLHYAQMDGICVKILFGVNQIQCPKA